MQMLLYIFNIKTTQHFIFVLSQMFGMSLYQFVIYMNGQESRGSSCLLDYDRNS